MAQALGRCEVVPAKNAGQVEEEDHELNSVPSLDATSDRSRTSNTRRRSRRTTGLKILIVLIGGFIVLAGAVVYLTFLWFGHRAGYAWSRIVLENWVTTSVVITTLVIRTVVAIQMTVVTSILALTVLKSGAPIHPVPRLSSLRYSNSGPLELLTLLFSSARRMRVPGAFALTLALAILTLLLQFSSTFLASDLQPDLIENLVNQSSSPVYWDIWGGSAAWKMWSDPLMSNPISYPKFAEFSNRSGAALSQYQDRYDDTGPSVRAILAVSQENGRPNLHSFKGNASIYDVRWICTRPTFDISTWRLYGDQDFQTLEGSFTIDDPRPPLVGGLGATFWCNQESTSFDTERWHLSTCYLGYTGLLSSLQTEYDTRKQYLINNLPSSRAYFNGDLLGDSFLVINQTDYRPFASRVIYSNGTQCDWDNRTQDRVGYGSVNVGLNFNDSWTVDGHGVWTSLTSTQAAMNVTINNDTEFWTGLYWPFRLDISLCSSAHNELKNIHIEARTENNAQEPVTLLSGMKQIGGTSQVLDFDERGILELDGSFQDLLVQELKQNQYVLPSFYLGLSDRTWWDGYLERVWYHYTVFGDSHNIRPVHESRANLLQQTLRETGSLALAMQAAAHTAITEEYYRCLPYFTNETAALTTFAVPAIQPTRVRGYLMFAVTLGLYTVITLITLSMVLGGFSISRASSWCDTVDGIDQSWQAHAQVWTLPAENKELFNNANPTTTREATVQTDAAVKKQFEKQSFHKHAFALVLDEDGYKVFRRREDKTLVKK